MKTDPAHASTEPPPRSLADAALLPAGYRVPAFVPPPDVLTWTELPDREGQPARWTAEGGDGVWYLRERFADGSERTLARNPRPLNWIRRGQ